MRVLHISNDYYNSGVYQTLHRGFRQEGLDSTFFVSMPIETPRRDFPYVVESHCFRRADRLWYMHKQRKIYRQFRLAVIEEKPDLLHGFFLYSSGIHCLWAKREFGVPYAVTVQNTDLLTIYPRMPHLRGLAREILQEAEAVFFISSAYRTATLERIVPPASRGELSNRFQLLPFALDPFWTAHTDSSAHPGHEGPIRLLAAGTVNANKNQLGLARAAELLEQRGMPVELTVVGEAADEEIDRRLRALSFVRRVPRLPKEDLIREYRRADLFALPSLTESFGLVYAEALSQGLPILYSAGQGFDAQFPEGFVGFHVDPRAPDSIAEGIQKIWEQYAGLQSRCGEAADRFSQERVCREAIEIYRSILSGNAY